MTNYEYQWVKRILIFILTVKCHLSEIFPQHGNKVTNTLTHYMDQVYSHYRTFMLIIDDRMITHAHYSYLRLAPWSVFFTKSRAPEHQHFLNWLVEQVELHHVDAVIVAGDIFDTGSPPSYARELYSKFMSTYKNRLPTGYFKRITTLFLYSMSQVLYFVAEYTSHYIWK